MSAMRTRLAALLGAALVAGVVPTAVASPATTAAATLKVIVSPVTASGEAANGFSVKVEPAKYPVDCRYKDPSIGAVSPNIESCSPSAAYPPACWKAAVAKRVLCIQDPTKGKLVQFRRIGRFADTPLAKASDRAPLAFLLTDGTKCRIRIGGAFGKVPHHPNLYAGYLCDRHTAAWVRAKGSHEQSHNGIDESKALWRVRTGYKHIAWRNIAKAYFVATAP